MNEFAKLVDQLYYLNSNNAKAQLLIDYLARNPDPDRGWAIGAIAGTLSFEFFKRKTIKDLIVERIDPVLFDLSYDYVGEMSETVAHLWSTVVPERKAEDHINDPLPSLDEVVQRFTHLPKAKIKPALIALLDIMTPSQRWALLKLGTRGLRIGVSARFLKKILAQYAQLPEFVEARAKLRANISPQTAEPGSADAALTKAAKNTPTERTVEGVIESSINSVVDITVEDIERIWHAVEPPYTDLLAWLEGTAPIPNTEDKLTFQPVMLAHPIADDILATIEPSQWQAEWKFDGIRAQLVVNKNGTALFSRTGDDISSSFPDLLANVDKTKVQGRFDGELLALIAEQEHATSDSTAAPLNTEAFSHIASFNQLQQRLNKKKPSKALMTSIPVGMVVYDALQIEDKDLREHPLHERSSRMQNYLNTIDCAQLTPTQAVQFTDPKHLSELKSQANQDSNGFIEGLMLKHKQGRYVAGRPKGQWYKLKRDPKLIDAVIMYAQRGHGKRSSFYSDFTFGCWQDDTLLPIGKAYSGFTDEELKKLDNWVRKNSIGRFGPVKEVKKELVFEVAFDAVQSSNRHKSKVALRFPRIHRIRWDKPAAEADQLSTLMALIDAKN